MLLSGLMLRTSRSSSFMTVRWSSSASAATTHFRVTLRRSAIGLPEHSNRVLQSLGLRRRMQSVYHEQSPTIAGMILAVKEIIHVENVRQAVQPPGPEGSASVPIWVNAAGEVVDAGRIARKAPRGFKVVGNLVNEERNEAVRQSSSA